MDQPAIIMDRTRLLSSFFWYLSCFLFVQPASGQMSFLQFEIGRLLLIAQPQLSYGRSGDGTGILQADSTGLGGSPLGTFLNVFTFSGSGSDVASKSAWVYGWAGFSKNSLTGPCSTTLPPYIIRIRSEK